MARLRSKAPGMRLGRRLLRLPFIDGVTAAQDAILTGVSVELTLEEVGLEALQQAVAQQQETESRRSQSGLHPRWGGHTEEGAAERVGL